MKKLSTPQMLVVAKAVGVFAVLLGFLLPRFMSNDTLFVIAILLIVASGVFVSLVVHSKLLGKQE